MSTKKSDDEAAAATSTEGASFGSMSRIGQQMMPPIIFEGRRYEQIMNGEALDLPQRTGYLGVFDDATDAIIAMVKVYDVNFDPNLEADVQDVFFTRMDLDQAGRRILIDNERGKSFAVDLDSLTVQPSN